MQDKRRLSLSAFLSTFLIVLLFSVCINSVYAYFSASAEREFTLNFATLELDLQNSSGGSYAVDSLIEKITGVMPGDTIDFSDIHVKNTGTGDAYVLVNAIIEISKSGMPTLTYNNWYNLAGGKVKTSNFAANVVGATNLTSGKSGAFNLSWTVPGEIVTNEYQDANINVTIDAHAVQSYLPEADVYQSESLYASYFIVNDVRAEETPNLLNLEDRIVRDFGATSNTSVRTIVSNSLYVGSAASNYYSPNNIANYSLENGVLCVTNKSAGYGIGFNVQVKPNTTYTLSYESNDGVIYTGLYRADGTFDSYVTGNKITTKSDTAWIILTLRPRASIGSGTFSNVQLVEGSTATEYKS